MIKFFRHIRRRLLSQSKLSRYLIYAAGEIILVMIGILLALQVNNWNEERKKRLTESDVVAALNREYEEAKAELTRMRRILNRQYNALSTMSENCSLTNAKLSKEKMDSLISRSYALTSFNPPNATLSDLINSGKIDVIRNVELRNLLSAWNGKVKEAKLQETFQGDFLYNRYTPFVEERIEFKYPRFVERMKMQETQSFDIDSRVLLRDVRFCNLVRRAIYWNFWVGILYNSLEKDIDEIIELTRE